jgi:hypothetical protein
MPPQEASKSQTTPPAGQQTNSNPQQQDPKYEALALVMDRWNIDESRANRYGTCMRQEALNRLVVQGTETLVQGLIVHASVVAAPETFFASVPVGVVLAGVTRAAGNLAEGYGVDMLRSRCDRDVEVWYKTAELENSTKMGTPALSNYLHPSKSVDLSKKISSINQESDKEIGVCEEERNGVNTLTNIATNAASTLTGLAKVIEDLKFPFIPYAGPVINGSSALYRNRLNNQRANCRERADTKRAFNIAYAQCTAIADQYEPNMISACEAIKNAMPATLDNIYPSNMDPNAKAAKKNGSNHK